MVRIVTLVSLLCLGIACGDAAEDEVPAPPSPPTFGKQVQAGPYEVPAGKEKYFCYATTLTSSDAGDIIRYEPFSTPSIHHIAVFKTIEKEPEGFRECPALTKQSWIPLYSGGRSTAGLTLPPGAGSPVAAGDQILVHIHTLNAAQAASSESLFLNLHYAPPGSKLTPAGIFAIGSMDVHIPVGARGFPITTECEAPKPLNVFAIFPHMHQSATKISLEYGNNPASAGMIYKLDPWNFGDQPMDKLDVQIKKGDFLRVTCTYDNKTDHELTYGESAANEMCYGILFYTPFDRLDGCIN